MKKFTFVIRVASFRVAIASANTSILTFSFRFCFIFYHSIGFHIVEDKNEVELGEFIKIEKKINRRAMQSFFFKRQDLVLITVSVT